MATTPAEAVEPVSRVSVVDTVATAASPVQLRPVALAAKPLFEGNRRLLRFWFYTLLLSADLACLFGAFALGSLVRHADVQHIAWFEVALAISPLFVLSAMHRGAYSLTALKSPTAGAQRAAAALLGSFAILFVVSYFLKADQTVSRMTVGVGLLAALVAVPITRINLGNWICRVSRNQFTATVIIADETFVPPSPNAMVVDALKAGIRPEPRNAVMVQRLATLLAGVDRVVIACPREVRPRWASMLKGASVCGEILSDEANALGAVSVSRFNERATLIVSSGPLSIQQGLLKRAFDLCVAVPITLFIAPVLIAIAIAIRLDSPGPIFFRQTRIGYGNRSFTMWKFRSMVDAACDPAGHQSTLREDARVTRVGAFIRRTSLDELPQLFNVIAGSMSLVGPRPHALGSYAGESLFWDVDDRYGHRHLLKPGITGLAQIRGYRGTAHRVDDLSLRLQSDLEYMINWSVWRDVVILVKTFGVLAHPNAY